MKTGWTLYRILGTRPEVPEGHEFRSKVPDLENHPDLWASECPYHIHRIANVDIENLGAEGDRGN